MEALVGAGSASTLDGSVGEMVELVTESNEPTGTLVLRSKAHAEGLLHRTVYVLVENSRGEWLLQRRHAAKKIAGGSWDLSAAEHLNPGEAYPLAALRGLQEELGIPPAAVEGTLTELLPPSRRSLRVTTTSGDAISDQEFVPLYGCAYEGPLSCDPEEVAEVRWAARSDALAEALADPESFTPWFLDTLRLLHLLPAAPAAAAAAEVAG